MGEKVLIGKIVGIHGLRGTVKVLSYAESPRNFESFKAVLVERKGKTEEFQIRSVEMKGNGVMLVLSGISSRSEAEMFLGSNLYIYPEALQKSEDEYYWHEVVGLQVQLENGQVLGKIKAIVPTGSNDVYVVQGDEKKEYLIPAVEDVVLEIDLEQGLMIIRALDGLLEL